MTFSSELMRSLLSATSTASAALGTTELAQQLCVAHVTHNVTGAQEFTTVSELATGEDLFVLATDGDAQEAYVKDHLVWKGGPFLAIGILALLVCPFLACARGCCKCCKSKPDGYSSMQQLGPVVLYLMVCCASLAIAVTNLGAVGEFLDSGIGGVCELETLHSNAHGFFDELIAPLDKISYGVDIVITDVRVLLSDLAPLQESLTAILVIMQTFADDVGAVEMPARWPLDEPEFLVQTKLDVEGLLQQTEQNVGPAASDLDSVKDGVDDSIIDAQGMLSDISDPAYDAINSSVAGLDDLSKLVEDAKDRVAPLPAQVELYSVLAHIPVFLGLFAGLVAIAAFFANVPKLGSACLTTTWCITMLSVIIMFIIAGVLTPVSVVLSDTCVVIEAVPHNFSRYIGEVGGAASDGMGRRRLQGAYVPPEEEDEGVQVDLRPEDVLKGCFDSVPIMTTLNMTSEFDFSDVFAGMNAPWRGNTEEMFDTDELDTLKAELDGLTPEDFGLYEKNVTDALQFVNEAKDPADLTVYNRSDCEASPGCDEACVAATRCAPESLSPFLAEATPQQREARQLALELVRNATIEAISLDTETRGFVTDTIEMLQRNIADIEAGLSDLKGNVQNVEAKLAETEAKITTYIIDEITKAGSAGDCSFLPDRYHALQAQLCGMAVPAVASLGSNLVVIAALGIAQVFLANLMIVRLFGPRSAHGVEPKQMLQEARLSILGRLRYGQGGGTSGTTVELTNQGSLIASEPPARDPEAAAPTRSSSNPPAVPGFTPAVAIVEY